MEGTGCAPYSAAFGPNRRPSVMGVGCRNRSPNSQYVHGSLAACSSAGIGVVACHSGGRFQRGIALCIALQYGASSLGHGVSGFRLLELRGGRVHFPFLGYRAGVLPAWARPTEGGCCCSARGAATARSAAAGPATGCTLPFAGFLVLRAFSPSGEGRFFRSGARALGCSPSPSLVCGL